MAFNINFDGDKANQWISDLERLNEETDALLKKVSGTLNEVTNAGSGQLIDNLLKVANGLTIGFTALMEASNSLAEKFGDILRHIKEKVTEITTDIHNAAESMYGGGGKSVKDTQIYS